MADLIVCHAGMNTVLEPLAAGVPMVADAAGVRAGRRSPLAMEQAGVAKVLELPFVRQAGWPRRSVEVRTTPGLPPARRARREQEIRTPAASRRAAELIEAASDLIRSAGSRHQGVARRAVMLMMIAEMEAGQKRGQPAVIAAPGPVAVAERVRSGAVRQEGAEQEELERGKDRRQRPEQQQVRIGRL